MVVRSEPRDASQLHAIANGVEKHSRTKNALKITDNRTGNEYILPIHRNSINAMGFKQMKAPRDVERPCEQTEYGIRVYDPGFGNTAVSESSITYKSVSLLETQMVPDKFIATASKGSYVIVAMTLATWSPRRTSPIRSSCCSKVTYHLPKKKYNGNGI